MEDPGSMTGGGVIVDKGRFLLYTMVFFIDLIMKIPPTPTQSPQHNLARGIFFVVIE